MNKSEVFNLKKTINIEIPSELIKNNSHEINYDFFNGKTILGCCGYSMSGKDTVGRILSERCGFHRVAFADAVKNDLNLFFVNEIFEELQSQGVDIQIDNINFIKPNNFETKEILRPYMIWYGEKMKILNGIHYWTNRAFQNIEDKKKIIITDVRRINELAIFEKNRERHNKMYDNRREINMPYGPIEETTYDSNYESLLIYVNQLGLTDGDNFTRETIIKAQEEWMFDYTMYVDSRIPSVGDYREKHMIEHVRKIAKKFPKFKI
jgi:hypothetical protein